ncbi:FAD/NAD(P)-binding domain-containing protein [Cerioporus squamosus]|nr:FAD/NAD(P)-binding domain-containing protein [Cerioporus squamosus]
MAATKVIIVGGGIAGPVLAMFLKAKGYDPVIYERTDGPTDMGLSLGLQPNGLRVLELIPGLLDKIVRCTVEEALHYSALPGDEGELVSNKFPLAEICGHGIDGARWSVVQRTLIEAAQERGITVHFSYELVDLWQDENIVTVKFTNGKTDEGNFLVGCDGFHSHTSICLFGKEEAVFMGLTQTGGISPVPEFYKAKGLPTVSNIYADGAHMISIPINETQMSWAITQREPEANETEMWSYIDEGRQKDIKEGPYSKLPFGGGDLVRTADNIVKFGLYERPELHSWHKGRVILIGDAARPISPHNPSGAVPSTASLESVFAELEQLRIPRTSELAQRARKMGQMQVVSGFEACKKRNDIVRTMFTPEVRKAIIEGYLKYPYEPGKSKI